MGRTARDNRDRPHPRPVQKIVLSEGNTKQRLIAVGLLLILGGLALGYAFSQLMTPDSGWQAIEASTSAGPNCGDEFVFRYELGAGGASPAAENRAVSALYTDECRKLFQLFHTVESFEGITNLRDLSLHPNETLTVDAELYQALETVARSGDRTIYLGPVYARYGDLFYCADDSQLVDFDPYLSDEVRKEYGSIAAFARDPEAVDVRLLGEGKVCLYVSEEYLAYAQREGIERFLDFGWMKNAFIADALAQALQEAGFTNGTITSYDGFIRNLDERGTNYSLGVYDYVGDTAWPAAVMQYDGPMSMVELRNYAANGLDSQRIYRLKNGERRSSYLSPEDGRCKSAANDLLCYSKTAGCGEIALRIAPIYVAEMLDVSALAALADVGIQSVYCENREIRGTDRSLTLADLYEAEGVRYTVSVK